MGWVLLHVVDGLLLAFIVWTAAVTYLTRARNVRDNLAGLGDKEVILTFDDGPDPRYTSELLDVLRDNGVYAVFFVTAKKAAQSPELLRRMTEEGHQIGLHTLEHYNPWLYGLWPGYARRDVLKGAELLRGLGCEVALFRPSWGRLNPWTYHYMKKAGLRPFFWNVMAEDWRRDANAFIVEQKLRARLGDKAIVCLHDSGDKMDCSSPAPANTVAALRHALPSLRERGWRFVLPGQEGAPKDKKGAAA